SGRRDDPADSGRARGRVMHIVVVGNSIAADCLLAALSQRRQSASMSITVIGSEPHPAYNRVLLSQVLAGELSTDDIGLRSQAWYEQNGIDIRSGAKVAQINRTAQTVQCDTGDSIAYDKLVLATGARARLPTGNAPPLKGIKVFRTLDDAAALSNSPKGTHTVVFGGGLLGLEAAAGLLAQGLEVTLVHRNDWLLNRQLDPEAGALLLSNLQARGLQVELGAELVAIEGDASLTGVTLSNGKRLAAEQVVFATGIQPRTELAVAAKLEVNRGVVVDAHMQTRDRNIFALGECAEVAGETVGLVPPIRDQATALANTLLCRPAGGYSKRDHAAQLKIAGIDVFSAGDVNTQSEHVILYDDPLTPARRKLVLEDGKLKAIMLYGDVRDGPWLHSLMVNGTDTHALRDRLLFGKAYCEGLAA
ncbi:MAG: FAD-dependent oxidoreductase, partial [Pseudomonadota bacterium]